mgnify:CR=1 FL=1|jgi:hypothetical protein
MRGAAGDSSSSTAQAPQAYDRLKEADMTHLTVELVRTKIEKNFIALYGATWQQ